LSAIATSQALFGKPNAARLHDFPGHLGELALRTEGLLGDPRQIALGHSLLGYFLAFTPADKSSRLLIETIKSSVSDIKMRLGIPASGVGGYHPLKCCQQCVQQDIQSYGWPIWHLEHQFPSVLVCRKHQRPLVLHWDDVTPVHRREWIKPSTEPSPQRFEISVANDQTLDLLLRLADISTKAAAMPPGTMQSEKLAQTYQRWAAENSMLSPGNSIRHSAMASAIAPSFDQICSSFSGMGPVAFNPQLGAVIGLVARTKPRPAHPLKHLVLITCMYGHWDKFWSAFTDDSPQKMVISRIDAIQQTPNEEQRSVDQFVQLIQSSNLSIRQAAATLGISTSTGVRWAKIGGINYTQRARGLTPEYVERVRKVLRMGKEKLEVMAETQITSVSLNRLLSSEPTLRAQWRSAKTERHRKINREKFLTVVKQNPGVPIWLLRKLPSNGWAWLYRHDRSWLAGVIPSLWLQQVDEN
jgi:hypothetical protein